MGGGLCQICRGYKGGRKIAKNPFKPGDILAFAEVGDRVGPYDFSFQGRVLAEKQKAQYRQQRWKVKRILENRHDVDGNNCLRLQRLDTKAKGLETWSPGFFRRVEEGG